MPDDGEPGSEMPYELMEILARPGLAAQIITEIGDELDPETRHELQVIHEAQSQALANGDKTYPYFYEGEEITVVLDPILIEALRAQKHGGAN